MVLPTPKLRCSANSKKASSEIPCSSSAKSPKLKSSPGPLIFEPAGYSTASELFKFGQSFGSTTPTHAASTLEPSTYARIVDLNSKTNRLTKVRARVTLKSALRQWSNQNSGGEVFHLSLYDGTGEIAFSCFNPTVYDEVEINDCIVVENFQVRITNERFRKTPHAFEISSIPATLVTQCESSDLPDMQWDLKTFEQIKDLPAESIVDFVAVCVRAGKVSTVGTSQVTKKDIVAIGTSKQEFTITLWNDLALKFSQTDYFSFAVRNGKLSINVTPITLFWPSPKLPAATSLFDWFKQEQKKKLIENSNI